MTKIIVGTHQARDLLRIADEATEAARNAANVAENYARVADEATEAANKASGTTAAERASETHVEGLVRKNHAQAANPTSDVSPWFEHGMTEFERELFYSVSETD